MLIYKVSYCSLWFCYFVFAGEIPLRTLYNELYGSALLNFNKIGVELGIPYYALKIFEENSDPLTLILDYWERGYVTKYPLNWKSVVTILKCVNEKALAQRIARMHCPGILRVVLEHTHCEHTHVVGPWTLVIPTNCLTKEGDSTIVQGLFLRWCIVLSNLWKGANFWERKFLKAYI